MSKIIHCICLLSLFTACSSPASQPLSQNIETPSPVPTSSSSTPETALGIMNHLRQFPQIREILSKSQSLTRESTSYRMLGATLKKTRGWNVLETASEIALPIKINEPIRFNDALDSKFWIEMAAENVKPIASEPYENVLIYRNVVQDTDVLHVVEMNAVEELRLVYSAQAPNTAQYRIKVGPNVSDVVMRSGRVEILDSSHEVRVMSEPMFLIDANGKQQELNVHLRKENANYIITATWNQQGLQFPIIVDPRWTRLTGPTRSLYNATGVKINNYEVMFFGGLYNQDRDKDLSKSTAVYNIMSTSWSYSPQANYLPESPHSHIQSSALLLPNQELIVLGGYLLPNVLGGYIPTKEMDIFNLTTRKWTAGYPMNVARYKPAMAWLSTQNQLFVVGGSGLSTAELYNPSTKEWANAGKTQVLRGAYTKAHVLKDGQILVVGGTATSTDTELFDPTKPIEQAWSKGAPLNTARGSSALVELLDGSLLVVGTMNSDLNIGAEIFNGKEWKYTSPLYCRRYYPNAVRLTNGLVLVMGEGCLMTPEVYDPFVNQWSRVANTNNYNYDHTSRYTLVALPENRALAISQNGTTELFEPVLGSSCTKNEECPLGFCVDGFCCDRTCSGQCESCKESGLVGTCVAVDGAPRAPRAACQTTTDGDFCEKWSCHKDQSPKECTRPKVGTECKASYCDAGVLIEAYKCSAKPKCEPTRSTTCLPFVCEKNACKTQCSTSRDCAIGTCNFTTGICELDTPRLSLSDLKKCESARDCTNGYCVDGLCCDSPCNDTCHSCSLPWAIGRCTRVPAGMDLRGDCTDGGQCQSTCGENGQCVLASAGSLCAKSECVTHSTGVGAGYCEARSGQCRYSYTGPFDCKEYACEPTIGACYTQCQSNEQCAENYLCDTIKKTCVPIVHSKSGCNYSGENNSHAWAYSIAVMLCIGAMRVRSKRYNKPLS